MVLLRIILYFLSLFLEEGDGQDGGTIHQTRLRFHLVAEWGHILNLRLGVTSSIRQVVTKGR
jgi:hypothetical protein